MIHIQPVWQIILEEILSRYVTDRQVVLFGSRAHGQPKQYSDIDLCIMGSDPVSSEVMAHLREAFSSSDLPVRVDVVDWATTSPEFQKVIAQKNEVIFDSLSISSNR